MRRRCAALALAVLAAAWASAAQEPRPAPKLDPTQESYRKARAVLDAGIKALVGEKALPGAGAVSAKMSGGLYHRHQSPQAGGPPVSTPYTGEFLLDLKNNAVVWERTSSFPGGFDFSNRWLLKPSEGANLDLLRKTAASQGNPAGAIDAVCRRLPQYLLQAARNRAATLRWQGETEYQGRTHNVISTASPTGGVTSLYFDAETNLLTKFDSLFSDAMTGDTLAETIFTGYLSVQGLQLPAGQTQKTGGVLTQDVKYSEWRVNPPIPEGAWATPPGFTPLPANPPPAPPAISELACDVFLIEGLGGGGYRVLFVAFRDFILVAEAPLNDAATQQVIRLIQEKVPGKPIRYVAATHHHDDHAGGLRGYLTQGVTVLTTPGNVNFFRTVAGAQFSIAPDSWARTAEPRPQNYLDGILNRRAVITDGSRTVQVLDIGPGPHADEMLVVWLPQERILFQGDLMNRDARGHLQPANDTTVHFAQWLRQSGLPVEKLVGVHSRVSTLADLQASLDLRAAQSRASREP